MITGAAGAGSHDALPAAGVELPPGARRVSTRALFLAVAATSVGIAWYFSTYVMTRELYHNLLGAQVEASRIDQFFDLLQRRSVWSHLAVPLLVFVRVGMVALIAQLVFLLLGIERPLSPLFRAALWAFLAPLIESASRAVALARMAPAEIDAYVLTVNPGSLAYWLVSDAERGALAIVLTPFTLTEAGWLLIFGVTLGSAASVSPRMSAAVAAAVWLLIAFFQVTLALYFSAL
jgi:hypothetical protein